jgi:predicted ATP-grasp superfamily ATP-dependent carboligase
MADNENPPQPRVLITDAAERSMIAVCRGLRAGGYAVAAAAFAPLAPGHWSRCCSERLRVTDPRIDIAGFAGELRRWLERRPCAALVPGSDFSLFAVSRERAELEPLTRIGLPPHEIVERSFDREVLAEAAKVAGLAPAAAVLCRDADHAVEVARELGYPVLLKSISTVRDLGGTVAVGPGTLPVADEQALRAAVPDYGGSWLVQRRVSGRTLSFGGVIAGGRLLGAAVSEYRRTWPPSAGNAAFSVTIAPAPELVEQITVVMRHLGWEGMFELELIEEPNGALTPIDLNPRPYGSMSLAVAAGANFPALWCDWLLGRTGGQAGDRPTVLAPPGRAYRWEDADLRHLAWQLRHGHYAAAARVVRPMRGTVHPHFMLSDPLPLAVRAASMANGKIRARRAARRR